MSTICLRIFAGAALAAIAAHPALAQSSRCTNPPSIRSVTLEIEIDGKKLRTSGSYCIAFERAFPLLMDTLVNNENVREATRQALSSFQVEIGNTPPGTTTATKKFSHGLMMATIQNWP